MVDALCWFHEGLTFSSAYTALFRLQCSSKEQALWMNGSFWVFVSASFGDVPKTWAAKEGQKKSSCPLKTLTSLNKEVRPFFLGDNSIWSLTLCFFPLAITAFGGTEGYFSLAIIGFGAFGFIVPKYCYRLGKSGQEESGLLSLRSVKFVSAILGPENGPERRKLTN